MIYDSSISSTISLSKILDYFISESEDSNIIITFLMQHDNDFNEILKYSLYYIRMFQLDFFLTCNDENKIYLIKKFKNISINDAKLFIWQILKSNSYKLQKIKYEFKKDFEQILKYGPKHPYTYKHESYISDIDDICFNLAPTNNISNIAKYIPYKNFSNYFRYIDYSLFRKRLMQYDVFSKMNDISKFIFIRDTFKSINIDMIRNFILQVFNSDEDYDVKKLCFKSFSSIKSDLISLCYNSNLVFLDSIKLINECKSFSEMMLKMSILNSNIPQNLILYLMINKPNWILEWIEYDEKELNSILNVSEFAKKLFN